MIVIDRLRAFFESRMDMTAICEPNNAMARRSVRIVQTGLKLSPLAADPPSGDFLPYELQLNLQVTLRLSGGNTENYLSGQMLEHGIYLNSALTDDLIVLRDIGEDLPQLTDPALQDGFLSTRIVGDAEVCDARRVTQNVENGAQDGFEPNGELYIYSEVWACTLVMTVHRLFSNPRLNQVIYTRDPDGEQLTVPDAQTHEEP